MRYIIEVYENPNRKKSKMLSTSTEPDDTKELVENGVSLGSVYADFDSTIQSLIHQLKAGEIHALHVETSQ